MECNSATAVLEALVENSQDQLVFLDRDFNFVRVNRAYAETCRRAPEQFVGHNHFELYPNAENRAIFERVRDKGEPAVFREKPFVFPDQPERGVTYWDWTLAPIKDETGRVSGLVFSLRDVTDKVFFRQRIQKSEEDLRLACDRANWLARFPEENPNPVFRVSADMRLLYANRAAQWQLAELLAGEQESLTSPELTEPVRLAFKRQLPEQREVSSGGRIYTMVFSPTGSDINVYGLDITGRKRAEEALRNSERIYRAIGESIDYGVWVCAPDGCNIYASESFLRMVGLSQTQCSNFGWGDVLHPDDRERTIAAWKQCVRLQGTWDIQHRFRGVDGKWHDVLARGVPVRNDRGEVIYWAGINLDIGRLKQAELGLLRSSRKFELLALMASELLQTTETQQIVESLCLKVMEYLDCQVFFNFLVDQEGSQLHLNAYAGIPAEEARKIQRLNPAVAACGCMAREGLPILDEHVLSEHNRHHELIKSFGIQAHACHPLMATGGKVIGTLSFGKRTRETFSADDLSFMKAVSDQVAAAMIRTRNEQELREGDRRKNQFLALLSHELRNPLAPIKNSLYVLEHANPATEQARDCLAVIDRQTSYLSNLVDDLLDLTRITQNKIRLQRQRLELGELMRRTAADYQSIFSASDITLELLVCETPVWIDGDMTRITQIVGNLLSNAAKFTPAEGRVELSLDVEETAALVRVRDNGVGIAAEVRQQLFQPFMQAEQTLSRSSGGLGLGLALVKGLTELHGGTVRASSEGAGQGAEFTLRLPLSTPEVRTIQTTVAPLSSQRRIVVIEDNMDSAVSLRVVLELMGHQVQLASTGEEGIAVAQKFRPDVVLCDIGLPGINGYQVAQMLRSTPQLQSTVLIALSGYAQPEDIARSEAAGFNLHLAKPPSLEHLERLLAEAPADASGEFHPLVAGTKRQ